MRAIQTFQHHFDQVRLLQETKAYLLMNMYEKTHLGRAARAAMPELGFPVLESKLGNRIVFGEASSMGKGVLEMKKDSKAKSERVQLTKEILTLF